MKQKERSNKVGIVLYDTDFSASGHELGIWDTIAAKALECGLDPSNGVEVVLEVVVR